MPSKNKYLAFSDACRIRLLVKPYVYNKHADELYELDAESLGFLTGFGGGASAAKTKAEKTLVRYCIEEGILTPAPRPRKPATKPLTQPGKPLCYLELQITSRCNLSCRHCYLGKAGADDLPASRILGVMEEFEALQGIRLLVSGGEPLMHRDFWAVNERLDDFGFRSVLLTNGTLIDKRAAARLNCHEAQVSLDGMRESHDGVRGTGNFDRAINAIEHLQGEGVKVSVATMVTAMNIPDLDRMARLIHSLGITEWNVDAPSPAGRLADNIELMPAPGEAGEVLSHGFGGGLHLGTLGYACGTHLMAIGPRGEAAKCGFYLHTPAGSVDEGLEACWKRIKPVKLDTLACSCDYKEECRGGCRYRAAAQTGENGPDPVKCHAYGVKLPVMEGGEKHDNHKGG